jgi:DNA-directed RNA polymerase specialized sigma24 family protein
MTEADAFPKTPWTLIRCYQEAADPHAIAALDTMARAYWRPLYACVRAMEVDHAQAEDEVQRLFESLISRESLRVVVPGEVRFRSFLMACLKYTVASTCRREMALKRGEGLLVAPLENDAAQDVSVPMSETAPELAMDRAWAREVFDHAFTRLEADAHKRGRHAAFTILRPLLRAEAVPEGYAGLAMRLEVAEGTARKMVFDLRARLGAMIRQEVAATVADPAEVENELRYLMSLL